MNTTISPPLRLRTFVNAKPTRSGDVPVSEDRLADFDDLVVYFAERDNREQYTMVEPDADHAELLVKQLKQYARINKLSTPRPEVVETEDGFKVTFRLTPKRSDDDGVDDENPAVADSGGILVPVIAS